MLYCSIAHATVNCSNVAAAANGMMIRGLMRTPAVLWDNSLCLGNVDIVNVCPAPRVGAQRTRRKPLALTDTIQH